MNEIPQEYDGGDVIEAPTEKHVIEYNITDAGLAELAKKYGGMVITTDNLDDGKAARKAVRDVRLAVEERRKELKADALAYGKAVDGKANEIKAKIAKVEEPLAEQLDAIANAEKLAEEERLEAIESHLAVLRAYGQDTEDRTLAELQQWQEQLNEYEITEEVFQEFREQAVGAKAESESRLRIAIERKQRAEEEAAALEEQRKAQAEEQEKLDAQRKEIEEAQAKLREEQEAAEAKAREEQAAKDAERQAELDAQQAELDKQREEQERKEQEEREQAEAEAAAARAAELAPDKEKLERLANIIEATELPAVASQQATDVISYVKSEIKSIADNIRHYAGEME
jgi:chromosome segregation ATPase